MCCNCCIYFPCWSSGRKKNCSVLSRRNRVPADSELQFWICSSSTCATSQQENSSCNFGAVTELNKWSPLVECRWDSDQDAARTHHRIYSGCSSHEHNRLGCAHVTIWVSCVFQLWRRKVCALDVQIATSERLDEKCWEKCTTETTVTIFYLHLNKLQSAHWIYIMVWICDINHIKYKKNITAVIKCPGLDEENGECWKCTFYVLMEWWNSVTLKCRTWKSYGKRALKIVVQILKYFPSCFTTRGFKKALYRRPGCI